MVKIIQKNNETRYQCEECDLYYREREWAEKCETWCREYQSCNIEIIQYAIQEPIGDKNS